MKEHKIIAEIKGKKVKEIVNLLKDKSFTAEALVNALRDRREQSKKNLFLPEDLNEIAYEYDRSGHEKDAFIIYEYAAELGDPYAAGNVALYYFEGLSPCTKDLKEAENFCEKAIAGKFFERKILMAKIRAANGDYLKAIQGLKVITGDSQYPDIKTYERAKLLEKNIMVQKLESLYEQINHPVMRVASATSATKLMKNKKFGWEDQDTKNDAEIEALDEEIHRKMSDKVQALIAQPKKKKSLKDRLAKAEAALKSYSDMSEVLIQRQIQTENHFFNPRRTKNPRALRLAKALEERRVSDVELSPLTIAREGENPLVGSARQFITAERSTVQTSVEISSHTKGCNIYGYKSKIGWKHNPVPDPPIPGEPSGSKFTYYEKLNFFGTKIKYCQKVNSHKNHLGDYYLYLKGYTNSSYSQIIKIIDEITQEDPVTEKNMAKLMLQFAHNGTPVNLKSLRAIKKNATQKNVDDLNRIFYHCFIKEIARWMLPSEESHNLPLATAQARALQLIIKGSLRMQDVFSKDAPYGVYTGSNIGSDLKSLKEKITAINNAYQVHVLQALPLYQHFTKNNPNRKVVSSRKGLHSELQETFGGESDTDGDGYESDGQREKLYKTVMG